MRGPDRSRCARCWITAISNDPQEALSRCLRADRGRILSALIARIGEFQLAEDALQAAAESALIHWGRGGVPARPDGWLIRAGMRKALDMIRARSREGRKAADWARLAGEEAALPEHQPIADERLRLIFTCCYPALDPKSRVALTLRSLCGLTTVEIARLYLDSEPTMGQRLSRAKAKIAAARIPFAVPEPAEWDERLQSVLNVVYLIYTLGHQSPAGPRELRAEAIHLARMIAALRPGDAEVEGALALLLLTEARQAGRGGGFVPLAAQDRRLWDREMIGEGLSLLDIAMARGGRGPFRIKAAIAALHAEAAEAGETDWVQIALLYRGLLEFEPSDVVRLNHAVALAESGALAQALARIEALDLQGYQPFHAARAALRIRMGDRAGAAADYDAAVHLSLDPAERAYLIAQKPQA